MMTTTFKLLAGLLLLAVTFLAPPAIVGNVLAGITSLALLGTMTTSAAALAAVMPMERPAAVVQVVAMQDPMRVFELDRGAGVVVFKTVDGKLTSRFYRAAA